MSDEVKLQPNVVEREGTTSLYYRARVPTELQSHYGKAEVNISLRTSDRRTANEKATMLRLKLDQEYASIRATLGAAPAHDVSDEELERIALIWLTEELEEEKHDRISGMYMDDTFFAEQSEASEDIYLSSGAWLARGDFKYIAGLAKLELKRHGIQLDEDSPAFRKACYQFAKATRQLAQMFKSLDKGEIVETPHIERTAPTPANQDTLQYLLEYWQSQKKPAKRSIRAASDCIKWLSALVNNKRASKITKADIVAYKDKRLETVTAGTVQKDLNLLKAIFSNAVSNAKLQTNPAEGVIAPAEKGKKKPRITFSLQDLQTIFGSPIYTENHRPIGGAGEASFWLPLISLFTGARLTEIGQLLTEDIQEEQGIRYFFITTESDSEDGDSDKSLKTASSHRRVPIHPELIRCGFMEYVGTMKEAGHTRLFPAIKSAANRPLTASFSQWFGNYKRKVFVIADARKTFHSFRHTFKDACRVSDINKELHDKLTGHASGNEGDNYGDDFYPLQPLAKAISKLSYEGLDLSHLYKITN